MCIARIAVLAPKLASPIRIDTVGQRQLPPRHRSIEQTSHLQTKKFNQVAIVDMGCLSRQPGQTDRFCRKNGKEIFISLHGFVFCSPLWNEITPASRPRQELFERFFGPSCLVHFAHVNRPTYHSDGPSSVELPALGPSPSAAVVRIELTRFRNFTAISISVSEASAIYA